MGLWLQGAPGAVVDVDRQIRSEAPELTRPVDDDRGGHRDEGLPLIELPGGSEGLERGDDLYGLPEPHVVSDY